MQAVLSPSQDRIAYSEQCTEHCTPLVVVLDLDGRRISSFQPKLQAAGLNDNCASISFIAWVGDTGIGVDCHINPSLGEFVQIDLATGRNSKDLLGFDFTPSPDGRQIAHVGWIIHFAPPFAQSYYLQFDRTTVYPLPPGGKPVEQNGLDLPPYQVREKGLAYSGIHEFLPGIVWSPDSRHAGLIDCTYTWTANSTQSQSAGDGTFSDRACSVVIVSAAGVFSSLPLTGMPDDKIRQLRLVWIDPSTLVIEGTDRKLTIP